MSGSFLPYAIQCAELAARRQCAGVREHLQRRVASLASIASTAAFLGFLGTVLGILNSFRSYGSSRATIFADVTNRISQAMAPGLIGLFVALPAFWFYCYLSGRMEAFSLEMENATVDLVNRLIVYLERLRSTDPALWSVLSRRPTSSGVVTYSDSALAGNVPRFSLDRMYRHGLLEVLWPRFASESDRQTVLETASWICAAYGAIGCLAYWNQHRLLSGLLILSLFVSAGVMIRKALPRQAIISLIAFFAFTLLVSYLSPYGIGWWSSLCCMLAPLPLLGSIRAFSSETAKKEFLWLRVTGRFALRCCW